MDEFLKVLAFAALPALGNFAGGLLAEAVHVSRRTLSLALHGAAGVVLAVVAVELMPQVLAIHHPWEGVLGFFLGGIAFLGLDRVTEFIQSRRGAGPSGRGLWVLFLGVSVDLFIDGILVGTGSTLSLGLGLLLALGQVPADIPEGFATIATFKRAGVPRRKRMLFAAAFAIPVFLGATLGYWAMRGRSQDLKLSLLAFAAGLLTTLVVEEMMPEAHESEEGNGHLATLLFLTGFSLFSLLSVYFD